VEAESVAVHVEVPKEEAAVETIGALKKQHGDRHMAVGRRRQLQNRLAAARRGFTGHTIPAPHARTMLQKEPRKDERYGRDVGRKWNATTA
jgi:hypothetical protein